MTLSEADERAILALRERLHGTCLFDDEPPYPADEAADPAVLWVARQMDVDRAWRESTDIPDGIEALCDARDEAIRTTTRLGPDQVHLAHLGLRIARSLARRADVPDLPCRQDDVPRIYPAIAKTAAEFARRHNVSWRSGVAGADFTRNLVSVMFLWYTPATATDYRQPANTCVIKVPGELDRPSRIMRLFRGAEVHIPPDATPDRPPLYVRSANWSFETP
jgi:hypothetical protein